MRHSIFFIAAALSASGAASAQSSPTHSAATPQIVYSVTESDLRDLVVKEGHIVDAMHPFEVPSVRGKTSDGLLFLLIGTACDQQGVSGCRGIMMQVRYDQDDHVTDSGILSASLNEAAISAWWDKEDKTVGFTRYVVLDDGVTIANLQQNIRVLLSIVPNAKKIIWP